MASVPMAPLIDMVFLLLVFFMTASAMSQASGKIELDLPEAPSGKVPEDLSHRLIVSIGASGELFVNSRAVALADLKRIIAERRQTEPTVKLNIRADKATSFESVKDVMKLAAELGVESYVYATYQTGD